MNHIMLKSRSHTPVKHIIAFRNRKPYVHWSVFKIVRGLAKLNLKIVYLVFNLNLKYELYDLSKIKVHYLA